MFERIHDLDTLQQRIQAHPALLVWFTAPGCNVCRDLKPRVASLIDDRFPQISLQEVDCEAAPAVAAQQQIFTIPSLVIFFDGAETIRKSRNFSLQQLATEIERPYQLFFAD